MWGCAGLSHRWALPARPTQLSAAAWMGCAFAHHHCPVLRPWERTLWPPRSGSRDLSSGSCLSSNVLQGLSIRFSWCDLQVQRAGRLIGSAAPVRVGEIVAKRAKAQFDGHSQFDGLSQFAWRPAQDQDRPNPSRHRRRIEQHQGVVQPVLLSPGRPARGRVQQQLEHRPTGVFNGRLSIGDQAGVQVHQVVPAAC